MEQSIDQKITDIQKKITEINAKIVDAKAKRKSVDISLSGWYAYYPTSDAGANERTSKINYYKGERDSYDEKLLAYDAELNTANSILADLQDQKKVEIEHAQATNQAITAAASVTAAQANLTPEQLYQLKLAEIAAKASEGQEAAKAKAMATDAEKATAEKAAAQKKQMTMIAIVIIIIVIGAVFYKMKK